MDAISRHEWRVETEAGRHDRAGSQDCIIEGRTSASGTNLDSDDPTVEDFGKKAGISKTVEFTVLETRADAS